VSVEDLKKVHSAMNKSNYDAKESAKKYYTLTCYNTNLGRYRFMKEMLLSPRSYATKKGSKDAVGCCSACSRGVNEMKKDPSNGPKHAIFKGLVKGAAPKCLRELHEVELAMISIARINKHVFAFSTGTHKQIKGWHSMYYNDLDHMQQVASHLGFGKGSDDDKRLDSEDNDDESLESSDGDDDMSLESSVNSDHDSDGDSKHVPVISVILTGPFTETQKALTRARTKVRWNKSIKQ